MTEDLRCNSAVMTPQSVGVLEPMPHCRGHIPALDGLRGIAILMVMLMHFSAKQMPYSAWGKFTHDVLGAGWIGVDLFFVLSGFLITGILIDAKGTPHYFRNFYARRSLRIFPLYYGYLALLLCIGVPLVNHLKNWDSLNVRDVANKQTYFWFYGTNILLAQRGRFLTGFVDHLWSLSIEEHFYLIWPAVIYCVRRERLLTVCLTVVALAMAARAAFFVSGVWPLATYTLTPCRMDTLAIGAAIAVLARQPRAFAMIAAAAPWVFFVTGLWVLGYFGWRSQFGWIVAAHEFVGKTVMAIFFAAFLVLGLLAPPGTWLESLFKASIFRFLGKYSYAMYVLHLPIWLIKMRVFPHHRIFAYVHSYSLTWVLDLLIPMVISVAVAYVSWHLYEKQFLKLKRFFEYRFQDTPRSVAMAIT